MQTPTTPLLFVAVLVSLALAAYGVDMRPRTGATAFAAFGAATAVWAGGVFGAAVTDEVTLAANWLRISYVGVAAVPVTWVVLTARYTGNDSLFSRRRVLALAVVASLAVLAQWTNGVHGLFYDTVTPDPSTLSGFSVTHGPLFFLWIAFGYALFLAGAGFLVSMVRHDQRLYRYQAAATLLAAVAPFVANVSYLLELTASDTTPIAFSVSGLALGWAMRRYQFLDVTPVARETVFEHIQDGVLVLDRQDRIVDANPAARRLLEVPADRTVVGDAAADAVDPPYDSLFERFTDASNESEVCTFETADGKRYVEVDVRPYENERGRERGWLYYLHDVTDRERRERELKRKNEQLDRFASVVSHDLRNPLNVAEGYVESARRTDDVDDLEHVQEAHARMRDIIEDVLKLAREGRTLTDVAPVDLATVAVAAWANVDTADATLDVDTTATVLADEDRLRHLLENCFRNAVQHGGAAVTVTVDDCEGGFFVADDGSGIPEPERDAVLEDGYSTHDDGTGLGLSIVTTVAGAHDWTTHVEASADGGARFRFTGTTFARPNPVPSPD